MFDQRIYLLLLWLLPATALLIHYSYRKKRQAAARFLEAPMVRRLMPRLDPIRASVRAALVLAALGLLIVAAAGPMFGVYFEDVRRKGADVYILLDVSRSMLAEDLAPNRLLRAKMDIRDLLGKVVGDRVGLIVFAGRASIQVPLTTDHGFFIDVLDKVDTTSAPSGGTAIGDAIRKALQAMPEEQDRDRAIVLITDGEDQDSMPLEAADEAAARTVRILAVGMGDARESAPIPIRDARGRTTFLEYRGEQVRSKPDEETLREIARRTGGAYLPAGTPSFDLGRDYVRYLGSLKGSDFQVEQRKRHRHQFQVFLAGAVLLLLAYLAVPEYRRTGDVYPALADEE